MPRAFTEDEKKLIGERLLQEGHRQFAAFGLKKVSVEELALAVGISKGAFYRFYESKEDLFMDVVEEAEMRFRQEVLAIIDLPGPSPKARLFAVLYKAFTLWKTVPILQIFTHSDYELVARRIPAETLQGHLQSDRQFIVEMIARCQGAGIPIQAQAEEIDGLLHALFFASLHEDDFGPGTLTSAIELLLELTVAFCLGEIAIQPQRHPLSSPPRSSLSKEQKNDPPN